MTFRELLPLAGAAPRRGLLLASHPANLLTRASTRALAVTAATSSF